jgi:hypothetical protein
VGGMLISTMNGLRMTDDPDRQPNGRERLIAASVRSRESTQLRHTRTGIVSGNPAGPTASCPGGEVGA